MIEKRNVYHADRRIRKRPSGRRLEDKHTTDSLRPLKRQYVTRRRQP